MNKRTLKTIVLVVAALVIAVVAINIMTAVTGILWSIVTTLLPLAIFVGVAYLAFLWLKKRFAGNL